MANFQLITLKNPDVALVTAAAGGRGTPLLGLIRLSSRSCSTTSASSGSVVVPTTRARSYCRAKGGTTRSGKYKGTQMREKQLTELIENKVKEAEQVCGGGREEGMKMSEACKVAWDEVEEVSQAKADLRLKLEIMNQDPLESYCQDNPETDECRIYED